MAGLKVALGVLLMASRFGLGAHASPGANSEQLVLNFCRFLQGGGAISCNTGPVVRIPRKYLLYDETSRDVMPTERANTQLALDFPDFGAWRELPFWQRWSGSHQQIHIELQSLTSQTVQDLHAIDFLGEPKAVPAAPELGLRHYQRAGWGVSDIYIPHGENPALRIQCPVPIGGRETLCVVETFTGYGLKLTYRYPRALLPHWAAIQRQVLSLVDSPLHVRRP